VLGLHLLATVSAASTIPSLHNEEAVKARAARYAARKPAAVWIEDDADDEEEEENKGMENEGVEDKEGEGFGGEEVMMGKEVEGAVAPVAAEEAEEVEDGTYALASVRPWRPPLPALVLPTDWSRRKMRNVGMDSGSSSDSDPFRLVWAPLPS